ncbi:deacetylase sulfotransferase [Amylibacter ulvae]|uniref:Deacetylase sulfotransferase n=1 Tax=Paramylibacter ulvae TaxID=1651968 RepID=A0ABQ3D1S8_9RHOB|nr:sulfotransferase [Amylibacter ulvae]GHA53387.1 deacetylase sulfotransferase [Amylibacter ulvae]
MSDDYPNLAGKTFLLGVGAHKSGTTWLSKTLRDHPQVFMSPLKELHFFGNRDHFERWPFPYFERLANQYSKPHSHTGLPQDEKVFQVLERIEMGGDGDLYRTFFDERVTDERVFGEITPHYTALKPSEYEYVKTLFPNIKIIFLMRDPIARHWSAVRFLESVERRDIADDELHKRAIEMLDNRDFRLRSDYKKCIKALDANFTPDQIHYEFFENLFSVDAMARIYEFLGVDYVEPLFDKVKNPSRPADLPAPIYEQIMRHLWPQYQFCRRRFKRQIPDTWFQGRPD